MELRKERTAVIVDLKLLEQNIRRIRSLLRPGVELTAVLKADGYGHGAAGIYPTFRKCQTERFAVAIWEEGAALREAGAEEPILLLGDTRKEVLPEIIHYRLTPTVFSLTMAEAVQDCARKAGIRQQIQIKIDTGMHRIGFAAREESVEEIRRIARMDHLEITGIFSHFARADEADHHSAQLQFQKFMHMTQQLENAGVYIPCRHIANSPAILTMEETQLDTVRAGDILYGLSPSDELDWPSAGLRQILSWYTYVAMVKEVPAGEEIGYGGTYTTRRPTRIATLPVGFADGYRRDLSNRGKVLIRGREAPIIGRICMDQCMADVTDIPEVRENDTVTLLDETLSVQWMADLLKTNVDEIVCGISKRVPRFYRE